MAFVARHGCPPNAQGFGRWLSTSGLVQRRRSSSDRGIQHHRDGPRHAHWRPKRYGSLRRPRGLHAGCEHILDASYRQILGIDRSRSRQRRPAKQERRTLGRRFIFQGGDGLPLIQQTAASAARGSFLSPLAGAINNLCRSQATTLVRPKTSWAWRSKSLLRRCASEQTKPVYRAQPQATEGASVPMMVGQWSSSCRAFRRSRQCRPAGHRQMGADG
jgi:hypothetical protein